MIADKIAMFRKKNGWSQEQLAEKTGVSRQAVSKWESAQATPDIEKIILLSELFGVSTDSLLKDTDEYEFTSSEIPENKTAQLRTVSISEAREYTEIRKRASVKIALATFLCIISWLPLVLLGAMSEAPNSGITDIFAGSVGLGILLIIIAIAVSIYIKCGFESEPFSFLEKESFEIDISAQNEIKSLKKEYRETYIKLNIAGTVLCILSPIAVFGGAFSEDHVLVSFMLAVAAVTVGAGVALFIISGVRYGSFQKLLKEGEYSEHEKKKNVLKDHIASVYWLTVTTVYLAWSFISNNWDITWIVWPVSGVAFGAIMCICNIIEDRRKNQ